MTEEQLNSLAETYRLTGSDQSFMALYNATSKERATNRRMMYRMGYTDEGDADAVFIDTFYRVIRREITGSFGRFLSRSLKNARIDFDRKERLRRQREVSLYEPISNEPMDEDDAGAPTLEAVLKACDYGPYNTAREALNKMKRAEQRQLLDSLLESADSLTAAIIASIDRYGHNYTAIANSLGITKCRPKRRLEALARKYDEKRFGDINDYLAV